MVFDSALVESGELTNCQYVMTFQDPIFQVKYSVSKLLLWLAHMQFPIQDQYICTSRENKQQKQLDTEYFT